MKRIVLPGLMAISVLAAQDFTRGVGIYPGSPAEYSGPTLEPDQTYRNLALRRAAYQSSSYDYNLTSQLVTDGIRDTAAPRWIAVSTSEEGVLPRHQRELMFDHNWVTHTALKGRHAWVQIEIGGEAPEIDRVRVDASARGDPPDNQNWTCILSGSQDGKSWRELGRQDGMARPSGELNASISLRSSARSRFYRFDFLNGRPLDWEINELSFFDGSQRVELGGPYHFSSAWKSAGTGEEWVYVDLGAACTFDRVALYWIARPATGSLEISDDAVTWETVRALPASGMLGDVRLSPAATARYVRVLMTAPASPEGYVLSEMEVYGRGGLVARPKASPAAQSDGTLDLSGGGWRLQRDSLVTADGPAMSNPGFQDREWLVAICSRNRTGQLSECRRDSRSGLRLTTR